MKMMCLFLHPLQRKELESEESSTEDETTSSEACESEEDTEGCNTKKSTLINQSMLNALVRDLTLTKDKAEILGPRLKEWNLFEKDTKISDFQLRHEKLSFFFDVKDKLGHCKDVSVLMVELGYKHDSDQMGTLYRLYRNQFNTRITAVSKSTRKNNWRFASLNCEFVHIYFSLTFPRICPSSPY